MFHSHYAGGLGLRGASLGVFSGLWWSPVAVKRMPLRVLPENSGFLLCTQGHELAHQSFGLRLLQKLSVSADFSVFIWTYKHSLVLNYTHTKCRNMKQNSVLW